MHNAFITINKGEKMAKSGGAGDMYSLAGIANSGIDPLAVRYYFLGAHYRTQMDFSFEALTAAQNGYRNLKKKIASLGTTHTSTHPIQQYVQKFDTALYDDLNTPQALAVLHSLVHSDYAGGDIIATVAYMDAVLGLQLLESAEVAPIVVPPHIQSLLDARAVARMQKDWAESDRLREQIKCAGFSVKDGAEGQEVAKV
jgi:cysteinyl-tRNA synthetase